MTDWHKETITCVVSTLKSNLDLVKHLVSSDLGIVRIFSEWVDPDMESPYVVVEYYAGGPDNDAQLGASDMLVMACAVTNGNQRLASQLQSLIQSTLADQIPDSSDLVGVGAYAPIELSTPYNDVYLRQGRDWQKRGGIYRVRLAELISSE